MGILSDVLTEISGWLRPHSAPIAMAMVATLLVLYGDELNRYVRRKTVRLHFVWRVGVFVLLCAVGYVLVLVLASKLLAALLRSIGGPFLFPVVVGLFVLIGLLAERRHQM
jgi:hypothetical protein